MIRKLFAIIFFIMFISCGEPTIEIDTSVYSPKIVVNGLLYTGKPIENIIITRNFPLNTNIFDDERLLTDAFVTIRNDNNIIDTLIYSEDANYHAVNQKLNITGGKTYTLYVSAEIEGRRLWTSSKTIVPYPGFSIDDSMSSSGDLPYLQHYENGALANPSIIFNRSDGAAFYGLSAVALDGDSLTFIEDNIFGVESDLLEDNLQYFTHISSWASSDNQRDGKSKIEVPWWLIYFYSRYRVTLYAGDLNFYHFFITHNNVMNIDGNLREPLFYFEGDGIGLFGSAIRDTIFFNVVR